jgi:hypothetical protein
LAVYFNQKRNRPLKDNEKMKKQKKHFYVLFKTIIHFQQKGSCMKKVLTVLAVASVGVAVLSGCAGKNPASHNGTNNYALVSSYEDASSQDIAKDVAGMSEAFNFGKETTSLAKQSSGVAGDIQWQSWTYSAGWWYRSGTVSLTSSEGAVDLRGSDSVQFTDGISAAVQFPLLADVRGGVVHHHASMHVVGTNGGYVDASRDWALTGSLTKAADTTLTLNGSLAQALKAENADRTSFCDLQGTATASDVVYNKQGDGWSKPVSGTVQLVSPYKTINITIATGTAHIVVTAKDGTVTKDVTLTL